MTKLAEQNMTAGAPKTYTASEARSNFADLFNEAFYGGPVIIRKSSRSVAVVSLDMLVALTDNESRADAERAREALKEFLSEGGRSWTDLKKELDLD
ncbi:type II toxin-antitoxin system prevent-host-death family antitoxin [Pelagibacterium montanilacus]|uniref:type II toxin-antitoxin system prevent-host-death family antitoxin n=1 Tax=Pelagibacterium montanilacus TaxID=2185280 RepID=UPI000F8F1CC0|nr:type II toxin-antitoxin system prevent-host-death family antitoxin [Pelagibacterium montanilacus]